MQFIKKLFFQLGLILFIFLLYLVAIGNGLAAVLFVVLLLCACYIIANEQKHKTANWLRVIIYAVIIGYLYNFYSLPIENHVIKLFHPDISNLKLLSWIYFDYFWDLLIIGVLALVLIFNKPVQGSFGVKKLISKFR